MVEQQRWQQKHQFDLVVLRFAVFRVGFANEPHPSLPLFSFNFQLYFGKYKVNPLIRMNHRCEMCMWTNERPSEIQCIAICSSHSIILLPQALSHTHTFPIGFLSVSFAFSHSVISLRWKAIVGFLCYLRFSFSLFFFYSVFVRSIQGCLFVFFLFFGFCFYFWWQFDVVCLC